MTWVVDLSDARRDQAALVGGKGANLGELARHAEFRVPAGFCVTTDAFREAVAGIPAVGPVLDRLAVLAPDDLGAIGPLSGQLRELLEQAPLSEDLTAAVRLAWERHGVHAAYVVRSSATAEDLPDASFAGQQDSFLDVVGLAEILENIKRCWASLFTERAVTYRLQRGFGRRDIAMAVVVQHLVPADAAGVMFTADPVTSNRTVVTVEAVRGSGEALVSGVEDPDVHTVRGSVVTSQRVVTDRVLTDDQLVRLAALGRRIEALDGRPQDVEWCRVGEAFHIVQSRAITTAFPPPPSDDDRTHVYVSVGHQQMMTDAMTPLGLSFWHLTTRASMVEAAGRLFVDVTDRLAAPTTRTALLDVMGRGDPLIRDALETLLARDGIAPDPVADAVSKPDGPPPSAPDPREVALLIAENEQSVARLRDDIAALSGPALFDFLPGAFEEDKQILFAPRSFAAIMAGMESSWWLDDHVAAWLGEKNVADALTLSAPHNITSEMGLALLDVADALRTHPEVVAFLRRLDESGEAAETSAEDLSAGLTELAGGPESIAALDGFLLRYGARCTGEIDIARPRWRERPGALVPTILGNIRNAAPGESRRRFELGERTARDTARSLLARIRELPGGDDLAADAERAIGQLRAFIGYREYPKFGKVARLSIYRQAVLREADRLVHQGILERRDDIFFLRFEELDALVRADRVDDGLRALVDRRREEFRISAAMTPPRVLTSEGEAVTGSYRRGDIPPGALAGVPVSAGTVEGRARVVFDMARADLEAGDILVTPFTDPSWTPLFLTAAGLITEVGGQMTHGAVIAREYGLPAVVGVQGATVLIRDGQRIRLHGSAGFVELLSS